MELYFAKLLGLYFIIIGVIMLVRRRAVIPTVAQLMQDRAVLFLVAILELAAGVGLALAYPRPEFSVAGALSVIGYLMALEGIVYLAAPAGFVRKITRCINRPFWYLAYGPIAILLGAYLAGIGFGYW